MILVLDGRTNNMLVLFVASALLTCTLEYLTSFLLEKLFHAKWWDYSARRFNLNGRVSLAGALVFGVLSVLVIRFVHPFVRELTAGLPSDARIAAAALILTALTADTLITVRHVLVLNGRLYEIQCAINGFLAEQVKRAEELRNSLLESFEQSEFYNERIKTLVGLNRQHNIRLLRAFPRLRSLKYNDAMEKLKETLLRMRDWND